MCCKVYTSCPLSMFHPWWAFQLHSFFYPYFYVLPAYWCSSTPSAFPCSACIPALHLYSCTPFAFPHSIFIPAFHLSTSIIISISLPPHWGPHSHLYNYCDLVCIALPKPVSTCNCLYLDLWLFRFPSFHLLLPVPVCRMDKLPVTEILQALGWLLEFHPTARFLGLTLLYNWLQGEVSPRGYYIGEFNSQQVFTDVASSA